MKDTELESSNWRYIVGEVLGQFSFDDENEEKRKLSKKIIKQEINYGVYLGVHAMIIPFPEISHTNYARIINKVHNYLIHYLNFLSFIKSF